MSSTSPLARLAITASIVCLSLIVTLAGCSSASDEEAETVTDRSSAGEGDDEPEVLLEPYDPPPLAELDASAEWIDMPVVDSLAKRRAAEAGRTPLVSVDEALRLRNTSTENNAKILSALGPMAPEDGQGVDWNAKIGRALPQDLRSTNPLLTSSISENEISGLTGFGLFGFDWNMIPHAVAASVVSWQTSKDRLLDKVVMRDDLVWSDGTPITAHDVVFSFKTIMDPRVPVPAMRSGTSDLRWVEAYDDRTLVYFQKQARATNVWNLNFSVIPKHIYEKSLDDDPTLRNSAYHAKMENAPVTGGAYEIAKRIHGQQIVLRRRESYYMHDDKQVRDKPYFAEINFRILEDGNTRLLALKTGDIDEAELVAEQWNTQSDDSDFYRLNTKVSGREWTYFYIGWNLDTPFFQDQRVRQAMSYALDHDEMLDELCYGLYEPCTGIYHPSSWMYPKDAKPRYRQDLDKAEDLLDAAGWIDTDSDGIRDKEVKGRRIPFEFTLMVSSKPDRIDICNLMRENLDSIGVICNVAPLEAAVMQERVFKKNFQAEFAGWGAGADPYTSKNIWGTDEGRNHVSYSNPEIDDLLRQGEFELDGEKRAAIYAKIHKIIYEDQPYTFLYFRSSFYGFNKSLRGYQFSPRGPFHFGPGFDAIWSAAH